MDEDAIEAKGLTPLADEMAAIAAITNKASLSAYLGTTLNTEVDGLTANADHVFGVWVNQGFDRLGPLCFPPVAGRPGNARSRRLPRPVAQNGRVARSVPGAHCGDPETGGHCRFRDARRRVFWRLKSGWRRPTPRTPMPLTSSSRTIRGNAPTLASRRRAWTGTPISQSAGLAGQPDFIVWQPSAVTGTSALVAARAIDAVEGLSQVSPDRTLCQRLAQGRGRRRFRLLRHDSVGRAADAGPQQARHRRHKRRAGPGGRPTLHATLFPARSQGESASHGRRPDRRLSRPHRKSHLDVAADKGKGVSQAGRASGSASAIPTHGSTIRRSTSCAATPSAICAARKPSIARAISPS